MTEVSLDCWPLQYLASADFADKACAAAQTDYGSNFKLLQRLA